MTNKNSKLVYSTNPDIKSEPDKQNSADPQNKSQPQILRIFLDKKGRKGKSVTVVEGFSVNPQHLSEIARTLKQSLGTGGTAKQGRIEIQGDFRHKISEKLISMGYKNKITGG
ncbi:translation initiation factor [candidate division KSB1 bacterium]|nr:translation initiation factor [candidate division KSB1 bacterium]